jgi:phage gpG-like protein
MIKIELFAQEAQRVILEVVHNGLELYPFYLDVGKILLNAVMDNFEVEGAYFQRGLPWAPLAPSTVRQRERLGYSPIQILRRTAGDAGLLGSINFSATGTGVTLGTNVDYAKHLHFGTRYMPPRPIFPDQILPPEVIEDITDAFLDHFKRT